MPVNWEIKAEWEPLDIGTPEERACFAALAIYAHDICLTEGKDLLANRLRQAPLLSAYHLAEWIAWNWWRLRWEPRSSAEDWGFAHQIATIGGGYIWPNLTIFSDGQRIALIAKPTEERPKTPFRYIADRAVIVSSGEFEAGIDLFINQVLERLDSAAVYDTNLETIWRGVGGERRTPELSRMRRLEALLGKDPDEADPRTIEQLEADAKRLGASATEEMAAEYAQSQKMFFADDLAKIANKSGYDTSPRDAVRLARGAGLPRIGEVAAWQLGARFAKALREQERLEGKPISDDRLASMVGVENAALRNSRGSKDICFALDENANQGRVVLRSKWHEGRRFELARILGDRLVEAGSRNLFPATRAYTYRQKMQRSFAAEFLSPFEAIDEMLVGDYSVENQMDVAKHFDVSVLTIRTLLVNHGRLQREELEGDFESLVA